MMNKTKLAYWTGIVQTDGCLHKKKRWRKSGFKHYISMYTTTKRSLPMLKRFQKLSKELFGRKAEIFETKRGWDIKIGANKLLENLNELDIDSSDPPKPPKWSLDKDKFFGAYMAGLIDGDGDVRVKRPEYPQCAVRISSGNKQVKLKESIEEILGSKASVRRREKITKLPDSRKTRSAWYVLEFYISSKNHKFIRNFVLPHLVLDYKRKKLISFIRSKI